MTTTHYRVKHPTRNEFVGRKPMGFDAPLEWVGPRLAVCILVRAEAERIATEFGGVVVEVA